MLARLLPLALLLTASASLAQDGPTRLSVDLSNFKFEPSTLTLHHGQSYTLHLVNRSGGSHDFVAKTFFAAAQIADGDRGKVKNGEVELGGGETADVHFTAPKPGSYPVKCSHFMHATFGMTGTIVVE
jgi:uncharacterized cupredoxin-like copper-binding protein